MHKRHPEFRGVFYALYPALTPSRSLAFSLTPSLPHIFLHNVAVKQGIPVFLPISIMAG